MHFKCSSIIHCCNSVKRTIPHSPTIICTLFIDDDDFCFVIDDSFSDLWFVLVNILNSKTVSYL